MIRIILLGFAVLLGLSACGGVPQQSYTEGEQNLTVGTVQEEIHIGMSGAEVAAAMGSPNIVTTDKKRRETWIYDKISQQVRARRSGAYGTLILFSGSSETGSLDRSQRTLTVIIKFDENGLVRDFAYHTSRF